MDSSLKFMRFSSRRPALLWFLTFVLFACLGTWFLVLLAPESSLKLKTLVSISAILVFGLLSGFWTTLAFVIHRRNLDYREIASHLHGINHFYRDRVSLLYKKGLDEEAVTQNPEEFADFLLEFESETLDKVTDKISNVFWALSGKVCIATVFLKVDSMQMDKDELGDDLQNDIDYVFRWATSSLDQYNNKNFLDKEPVSSTSVFNKVSDVCGIGESVFYCPDVLAWVREEKLAPGLLTKNAGKIKSGSFLVVPIQWEVAENQTEVIGYLSVESASKNRLDGVECTEYLKGFADQMFNFITLIREGGVINE